MMEKISSEQPRRTSNFELGKVVSIFCVCLFLSLPNGITSQDVQPDGIGVCLGVIRKIESFTISYIQSQLVSFKGVCSWLEITGCDQYKIVFTPAYRKAFRTVYERRFDCCRGYRQQGRRCVPSAPGPPPTKRPMNKPRPPSPPSRPSPTPDPRPPPRPSPEFRPPRPELRPPRPSDPNPGGGDGGGGGGGGVGYEGGGAGAGAEGGGAGAGAGGGGAGAGGVLAGAGGVTGTGGVATGGGGKDEWGDLGFTNNDGLPSNSRPDGTNGSNKPPTGGGTGTTNGNNNKPTPRPEKESRPTEFPHRPGENATSTLRLLMVIGILLSVIGISVACSLCMMCWNHTKSENRRTAKSYAYVSKGKDDSTVTISTISRGYSVESFSTVSKASACDTVTDSHYKPCELDEGDSGIGKGSFCSDESTSLVSEGSNSLDKNQKPPKYSKRSVIAARLASAGTYSCTYLGGKSKKQDRERLTGRETWNDIRNVDVIKEQSSVYHTLEPEIFEEEDTSDDASCDSGNVTTSSGGDKPKVFPYAKVKLDKNTGMFYGTDNRYGVFPVQAWLRPGSGSTEYGSLASSTMTLSSNNGYDRLDRNCRQHQQGDVPSSTPCRHRDVDPHLVKLKPPPPPVSPKPHHKHSIAPPVLYPARLAPSIPGRHSLAAIQRQSNVSYDHPMRDSTSNVLVNSDNTLTPPPSPHHAHQQLLNANQEYKRLMGGSLGDVSARSDGCQNHSKPSYTKFVASSSWNDVSTTEKPPKPSKVPLIKNETALYSTVSRENVSRLTNKLSGLIAPAIFVQSSNSNLNNDPAYTTVMRMSSSASDVSSISDGKLTPPPQKMHGSTDHTYGSISDISETSDDRYMNSARNTGDFSDIDLNTPRNTKDFSDIELVNLSSESLKMDTRYSIASGSSNYAYT